MVDIKIKIGDKEYNIKEAEELKTQLDKILNPPPYWPYSPPAWNMPVQPMPYYTQYVTTADALALLSKGVSHG